MQIVINICVFILKNSLYWKKKKNLRANYSIINLLNDIYIDKMYNIYIIPNLQHDSGEWSWKFNF